MMAWSGESSAADDPQVPHPDEAVRVKDVQSHYLRCASPSFSMMSGRFSSASDRFSMISGSDAESIFMEPIHLSSSIAAKKIISEELRARELRTPEAPDNMLESAEQLMVEDLYNRVKDMIDDRSPYNTPCVLDIQRALTQDRLEAPFNPVDQVWPNIYIAEKSVAVNKGRLKRLGITHVLNAAHGTGVYTGLLFYQGMNITYKGIEVDDFPDADISPHFRTCAEFMDDALLTHRGKVLVDSMMGVSRSAVLVAAYLMIFQNMSIMEALLEIRKKRAINPNEGFIKQLRQLNETLMEERDEDDDDTLSQCSVIDTRTRHDEEESMFGVKAESIMVDEEEDSSSVMSSVASSAAAAALKAGLLGGLSKPDLEVTTKDPALPGKDREDEDGDVDSMIREWQKRNEKYQNEDWWEAQLMCDGEDGESLLGDGKPPAVRPEDLQSVTSEDVRMVKERIKNRPRRPASDIGSTTSHSSFSDLWKQRLKDIEEQAAARYRLKEADEDSEASQKRIDDDVESILSDSSSMYNFCKKNKENLTPLERWKVKRIQFGWNKKDENGEQVEAKTEAPAPSLEDVNLTAYQTWKLKQQKKHGGEEDKDEILKMSRAEDPATIKKRQRREELLERTRKTLEESQSVCVWETESALSGSIPLSAFCAGAFPSASTAGDDTLSVLSGRSSVLSGHSTRSQPPVPQEPPAAVVGPNGEPMVNISNIQNWIANVVNETLMQKQAEMMTGASLAPSRAGSVFSLGVGRGGDDDKASMLSGSTYSSRSRAESVLSLGGKAQSVLLAGGRAESVISAGGASNLSSVSRRSKITTTSVPLYSLFQDQVNLHKLDTMEKEIKSEMRDKMASYEVKKIAEDNKRSTLYKKKKPKEEEDNDEVNHGKPNGFDDLATRSFEKPKPKRDYGRSGILNLPASACNPTSSIDEWLENVRPPQSKPTLYDGDGEPARMSRPSYEEPSEFDFPSRRSSISVNHDEEEEYSFASRFASRHRADDDMDLARDPSPEFTYRPGLGEDTSYRTRRSYANYENNETVRTAKTAQEDQEDEEISAFIAQIKQRARARVAEEMEDDEVLSSWRKQEESKSHVHDKN
ncbi:serine/threonine/tyrosine-interacting-like protein 2 isoform X1 [Sinocyclocheilus rhinocerous]|uniref:Inactive dual specificity phosphatase 27 n=1 Tax=Sinocyclocheilus rhinocerous TaxID=307959 RepID=A0A673LWX2_9TELE|nr:PREDICTED: inactive dual specificity phosphatase 27 isoform X1 [Sinocyclocheilus rhinocerous]XP_016422114.1 PREDICTED: inactive dual specificity phosphatase 27 isoform X1 [Sinocyclocheilus rhinocerous]